VLACNVISSSIRSAIFLFPRRKICSPGSERRIGSRERRDTSDFTDGSESGGDGPPREQ
jgi:hypothetical protein